MTKGKQWSPQQETELKNLVEANKNLQEIAEITQKTPGAIILKCQRLGLRVQPKATLTQQSPYPTTFPVPKKLCECLPEHSKAPLNQV